MTRSSGCWLALAGLALLLAAGCEEPEPDPYTGPPVGLLGEDLLFPYPSMQLMVEDAGTATGYRVHISESMLPQSLDGTPMPLERANRLDGFSRANTAVVLLPDAEIDPASLPPEGDLAQSMDPGAAVQILDLDSGERIPSFAELDAHPDCTGAADRVLLVRPMQALAMGGHHAVVLTSALQDTSGATFPTPENFAALRDGGEVHPGLAPMTDHYESLFTRLEELDLSRADLVLAWDFFVASEAVAHAHLDQVLAATREALPAEANHDPAYEIEWISDTDEGYELNEHSWRLAQGTFELPSYLNDDGMFTLDDAGDPVPQGTADMGYLAMVPASLHDASAGSAPVLVFGHGIFRNPYSYIGDDEDPQSVLKLADRLGFIVIGTDWRGLSSSDMPDALQVANDFGLFPLITDKLVQAVPNQLALTRLVQTQFREAEMFQALDGSGSLIDPDRVYYMGISLGGIEGATLMAHAEHVDYGVLHVGGSIWSTMLERSSDWPPFESMMTDAVPSTVDRQLLYAVSQLMWDPVDPISHVEGMRDKSLLWQESMGDEQVPNMTTEALTRSVGVPLLVPAVEPPYGMTQEQEVLGPGASALMQFDPLLGRPEEGNRPAAVTGAHYGPRHTDEAHAQVEAFFEDGVEGTIIHPCGDEPCVFQGEPH